MIAWLLLILSLSNKSPVIRTCFTNDSTDYDMKAHHEFKEKANFCIYKVNDCKNAELIIYLDSDSEKSFYISSNLDSCK